MACLLLQGVESKASKVSKTNKATNTAQEAFVEISAVGTTSASFPTIIGADGPELTQVQLQYNYSTVVVQLSVIR